MCGTDVENWANPSNYPRIEQVTSMPARERAFKRLRNCSKLLWSCHLLACFWIALNCFETICCENSANITRSVIIGWIWIWKIILIDFTFHSQTSLWFLAKINRQRKMLNDESLSRKSSFNLRQHVFVLIKCWGEKLLNCVVCWRYL